MQKPNIRTTIFILFSLFLGVLLGRPDFYRQADAQTPSSTITVDVFHLCLSEHLNNPDIDCLGFSVGSIRSVPGTVNTPWRCQANDPVVYPSYDWKENWGCGRDPADGQWHYPASWSNPVTLDIEEYLYDVLSPEMDPSKYPLEALLR